MKLLSPGRIDLANKSRIDPANKKATPSGIALLLFKYYWIFNGLYVCGLAEVSFEQTLECLAVSCFILCHFVYCVMDSVEILLFSQ